MKRYFIVLLCILAGIYAKAQTPARTVEVTGVVIDSATNKPLSYVTVALRDVKTSKPVKSALTKDDGNFQLAKIAPGTYQLAVAFVGYTSKMINVTIGANSVRVGKLLLSPSNNQLKEVSVTAVKPIVKQEVDRIGYDVQADPEVKSLTVLDMLRKVPMVSVDGNNNIKLRGNDSYKILINGKESALMAKSPSDVLKAMPASNIEKIEVITTPPAKYDAEGLAGIINIITKKDADQGYNGNISVRYNTVWGPGVNFNGTVKEGKFGLNAYVGYNRRNTLTSGFENNTTTFNPASELMQNGNNTYGGHNTYGSAELSYEIDSLNLLTGSFTSYGGTNLQNMDQQTVLLGSNNQVSQSYHQLNNGLGTNTGTDLSLNYQLGFKRNKQQLLTLSYKYSTFRNNQFTGAMFDSEYNYQQADYQQYDNSGSKEHTIQVDYAHPLKKLDIEVGGKAILRNSYSDFHNDNYNDSTKNYVTQQGQINDFNYHQNVYSIYNSYQLKLDKWTAKGGLRLEHTYTSFASSEPGATQNYNNLVPSISVQRSFKSSSLTLGLTQRIQRPGIWQLNPFVDSSNTKYLRKGNPFLRPATTNNIELNYGNYAKGSINLSAHYAFSSNSVQSIATIDNNAVTTNTFTNAGKRDALGLDVNVNYPLTKAMNINLNAELLHVWLEGIYNNSMISNRGYQGYIFTYTGYKFKNDYRAGLNLGFDSRYVLLQGVDNYYFSSGLSGSKDIWKGKGSINVSVNNPFRKYNNINFITRTADFYTINNNYSYYRNIFIGFTYKFGRLNGAIKKNQKDIQNDDVNGGNSH